MELHYVVGPRHQGHCYCHSPVEFYKFKITLCVKIRLCNNTIACFAITNTTEMVKVGVIIALVHRIIQ